ncbi:hypothetical protein JCM33374_g1251 [Metschnikowia sp. JCM 33374]|nr:hypothetical protein JCM33374_g1251 [Metschnikowia sp. JCM 33374]
MSVFENTHFLVIEESHVTIPESSQSGNFDGLAQEKIERLIVKNGGVFTRRMASDSEGSIESLKINHIISRTTLFAEYATAMDLMVPVTTPMWLVDSVAQNSKKNFRLYSPQPSPFMDKVVLCIADNLAQEDKELMYAGVRAFGGQYLDALSSYTTHLVAADLTNNKSVVAANIRRNGGVEIRIVLPHWVDACMRQQCRVDETPYLLTNPKVLSSGKPDLPGSSTVASTSSSSSTASNSSSATSLPLVDEDHSRRNQYPVPAVLSGKRVFLAPDYHLSEHLKKSIYALIQSCGGSVDPEIVPGKTSVYVGKYRSGPLFRACFSNPHVDVASLQWLYHIVVTGRYVAPLSSNLLHFPVPEDAIPEFKNLRISISGINGDARHYLTVLITAMGATFTKTLDCNNDFLICAQKSGDKYNAAKTRWPDVKIVNHLWIEDSFAAWSFLDPKDLRYTSMNSSTQILGKVRLSKETISHKLLADVDEGSDVGDSVYDGDSVHENDEDIVVDDIRVTDKDPVTGREFSGDKNVSTGRDVARFPSGVSSDSQSAIVTPAQNTQRESQTVDVTSLNSQDSVIVNSVALSSPAPGSARAGRSAKAKASLKLHSDMEDLNQYTSMSKSSRKMKTYMEQLEKNATPTKKKKEVVEVDEPELGEPQPKKVKVEKKIHLVAIMTGCEQILTLTKADMTKLSKIGISIVNDYSTKKIIDTIIAPRVLRTEKFLKSLSKAKRIVHPSFLSDILTRHSVTSLTWSELTKEFNIENYSLDKVVPIKQINDDLGFSGKESGLQTLLSPDLKPVFEGYVLNLSSNLNGGADLISSILREHGLAESKTVKLSAGTRKSGLLSMEDGTTILVAHKSKDKKFASKLDGVTVVEWEWCVRSIFHKEAQNYEDYLV